jgi:predicted dienelactone hydrolase
MARLPIVLLALCLAACDLAPAPSASPPAGAPPIGMERLNLEDPARRSWDGTAQRPLATTVWYPAADGSLMTEVLIPADKPVFTGGFASRNAVLEPGGRRPLILLSHGTGGSGLQMMWLARRLAAAGYIVAAVDHHGNTAAEDAFDARGFRLPWERARDLSAMLDQLLAHPRFGEAIDPGRVGAAGFSLGGYTVVALAGGRTSLEQLEAFCAGPSRDATCDPQAEYPEANAEFERLRASEPAVQAAIREAGGAFGDPRISSVAALAPALGQAFTPESLSALSVPVLIIGAEADATAPVATNAGTLGEQIKGAETLVLPDATHYVFLNACTSRGQRFVPVCKDAKGVDRLALHDAAAEAVVRHFNATLPPA